VQLLTRTEKLQLRHIWQNNEEDGKREAFVAAAGEIYLYSLANFHIVTSNSGFGLVGAQWSKRWHNVYQLGKEGKQKDCGINKDMRIDALN
jgi:hypothetical protein